MEIVGDIQYQVRDAVAWITFNRPDRRNAISGALRKDIRIAMERADADREVRVIVLTGAGSAFCAGGDLNELLASVENGRPMEDKVDPPRDRTLLSIFDATKPVIAAVNGAATGAGMSIALAADIRVASSHAVFSQSFVKRGMHPDYGSTYLLPRIVGLSKALELMYTGALIDADEALRLQLVSRVVAPERLLDEVAALAATMVDSAPIPVRLLKRAVHQAWEGTLRDALDRERMAQNICYETRDGREGMAAFLEKREPVFEGS